MEFWIGAGLLSIVQLLVFTFDYVSDENNRVDKEISSGRAQSRRHTMDSSCDRSARSSENERIGGGGYSCCEC